MVLLMSLNRKFLILILPASIARARGLPSFFSSDDLKILLMLPPRSSFARENEASLMLSLLMWMAPSFLNPFRENVATIDPALASVSASSPSQSVTGSLSMMAISLITNALNGFK